MTIPERRDAEKKWKYEVWKRIMQLPSYGLIAGNKDNPMLSREQVIEALDGPKPKQPDLGEEPVRCFDGKACPHCGGLHYGSYFCPYTVKREGASPSHILPAAPSVQAEKPFLPQITISTGAPAGVAPPSWEKTEWTEFDAAQPASLDAPLTATEAVMREENWSQNRVSVQEFKADARELARQIVMAPGTTWANIDEQIAEALQAQRQASEQAALERAAQHFPLSFTPWRCVCGAQEQNQIGMGPLEQWKKHLLALLPDPKVKS